MSEYPRMLYRDGSEIDVNGALVDTTIVHSLDEMRDHLRDGWRIDVIASVGVGEDQPRRVRPPLTRT